MKTELENKQISRLSNAEANRITKECLQIALMKLMAIKPFEKITISEITKNAGVSRTAFYRNYNSKEEVIEDSCESVFLQLQDSFERHGDNWREWYLTFFKTIQENKETFKYALEAHVHIGPTDFLNMAFPPKTREEYYLHIAKEAAFYRILGDWFTSGMKEAPETMADLCVKFFH